MCFTGYQGIDCYQRSCTLPPLLSPLTGNTHVHSGHSLSVSLSDVLQVYQSVKMVDIALMVTVPALILMLGGGVKLVS